MLSCREDAELCCDRRRIILIIMVDENLHSEGGPILVVGAGNGPPKTHCLMSGIGSRVTLCDRLYIY